MEISYGRTNSRDTVEMPSMAAISSRISLPISFSVRSSVLPDSAIWSTPCLIVTLETMGFSVSVGKVLMPST